MIDFSHEIIPAGESLKARDRSRGFQLAVVALGCNAYASTSDASEDPPAAAAAHNRYAKRHGRP